MPSPWSLSDSPPREEQRSENPDEPLATLLPWLTSEQLETDTRVWTTPRHVSTLAYFIQDSPQESN
jgi:hypothetical protein